MLLFFYISDHMMKALYVTLIIELFVLLLINIKSIHIYVVAVLMNIFTNLSMNLLLIRVPSSLYHGALFGFEIVVILVETLIYFLLFRNIKKALYISLACNISSYIIGMILLPMIY